MTRIFLISYLAFLTLATSYLAWQNYHRKLAYVDSAKLLNSYQAMVDARKSYGIESKKWQANIDTLATDVQHAIRNFEHDSPAMTAKERGLASDLLRTKQQKLVSYQRTIQEKARQEDSKGTQRIVIQINAFLERYGKAHDYDLILVANPSGTIAYAKSGLDLTEEVVTELNKEYSGTTR